MAAMRQRACERCDTAMASSEWPDEALCPRCQHAAVGLSEGVGILPNGFFAERLRRDKGRAMTTYSALQTLIERDLRYRDWTFQFDVEKGRPRLRVTFDAPCAITGEVRPQNGRWWPLSLHMTRSEVVSTALKAVLTAVEHEAREDFLYRGEAVFGPHFDVDQLHALCHTFGAQDVRP